MFVPEAGGRGGRGRGRGHPLIRQQDVSAAAAAEVFCYADDSTLLTDAFMRPLARPAPAALCCISIAAFAPNKNSWEILNKVQVRFSAVNNVPSPPSVQR